MSDTRRRAKRWPDEIPFAYVCKCCVSPDRGNAHRGDAQAQLTCPSCAWDFDTRMVKPCHGHAKLPTAGSNRHV